MHKMKPLINYILISLCLAALSGPWSSAAVTIWNGPLTTFTQTNPYPGAGDRDQLTPGVALTRASPVGGGTGGMFNAVTETSFTKFVSPDDTEWAVGNLADYATLTYADWTTTGGGNPVHNYPGQQLVVHLISDDIYLSLKFTSLSSAPGFTYDRSTPTPANVPPAVAIVSPTNGASFTAPATVPITATASDSDGSVTNVSFFDGATLLGRTNNTPYTVTAGLGAGAHALTAVATDNLGLSTTSAVVNVTVSAANTPPSVTITNPVDGAILSSSASLTIRASATDSDGTVTNVQFFDGLLSLGNDATSPFSFNSTFSVGSHTFTAVATDNLGAKGTSAPVNVTMARYLPAIGSKPVIHSITPPMPRNDTA